MQAVHPAKTVVVAYGSFKDVAFEGGPRPWPMLEQGHYVKCKFICIVVRSSTDASATKKNEHFKNFVLALFLNQLKSVLVKLTDNRKNKANSGRQTFS